MGQASGKEKGGNSSQMFDGGYLVPQGVYSAAQDYNHDIVHSHIKTRKLAPFYTGLDDDDAYAEAPFNTECPICFLTRCCSQPICTECFVQIKRADPTHTNPPSSEPAACPYCMEENFGVIYKAPPAGILTGEIKREAGTAEGASAVRAQAEGSAEGSGGSQQGKRRKSFGFQDPEVITIDMIRPDWEMKLNAAQAATTRRANRRIIMRQVGDRLIPVGVSSSRLGADLPPGSTTGPGGAIIIQESARWGPNMGRVMGGGDGRSSRSRRELSQLLQMGGGAEVEEMMMMEAMRLSLLEHEDEQRRQAQAQSRENTTESQIPTVPTSAPPITAEGDEQNEADTETASAPHIPATSSSLSAPAGASNFATGPQSNESQHFLRTSSLAESAMPTSSSTAPLPQPVDFGLSSGMMAQLSELMDGAPPPAPVPAPNFASREANAPLSDGASPFSTSPPLPSSPSHARHTSTASGGDNDFGSGPSTPSRTVQGTNPNNPFRRLGSGSNTGTPNVGHSRQGSSPAI